MSSQRCTIRLTVLPLITVPASKHTMVEIAIGWSEVEMFTCFFAAFDGVEVLDGIHQICCRERAGRHFCRFQCH